MSKRKAAADANSLSPSAVEAAPLGPGWKAVLSVLLALHVLAVFIAPFAFTTDLAGGSPFASRIHTALRPYIGAMYLQHGYYFFAPNPGPTHRVRYRVEFDDGREPVEGIFPDLAEHRPRLLYHRHFMLAEELNNRFTLPQPPPEPVPPPLTATDEDRARYRAFHEEHTRFLALWRQQRDVYEAMRESIEQHLMDRHGGARVTLTRLERRLVDQPEVRELGKRIDDTSFVRELSETSWPGDER
jgi:hypothetical protein